jgi:hypothetical protein
MAIGVEFFRQNCKECVRNLEVFLSKLQRMRGEFVIIAMDVGFLSIWQLVWSFFVKIAKSVCGKSGVFCQNCKECRGICQYCNGCGFFLSIWQLVWSFWSKLQRVFGKFGVFLVKIAKNVWGICQYCNGCRFFLSIWQ